MCHLQELVTCLLSGLYYKLDGDTYVYVWKNTLAGLEPTTSAVTFHVLSFFTLCLKCIATHRQTSDI